MAGEPARATGEIHAAIARHATERKRMTAVPDGEEIYCRSYVNFYLANGAVIAPAYGIAEDAQAAETLRRAYPDRRVVTLELRDLFRGGGGIHCITQQEPRARAT